MRTPAFWTCVSYSRQSTCVKSGLGSRRVLGGGLGLLVAGFFARAPQTALSPTQAVLLAVAGVLVGFGARLGGGCTSGHGVCGVSRLSIRSIVATLTFMATGAVTVFFVRHVLSLGGGE
jgi:uncharacterized membrane protein YedE/YeeE